MSSDPLLSQFNRMMPLFEQATGDNWVQYDQILTELLARYEEEEDPEKLAWIEADLQNLVAELAPALWNWTERSDGSEMATVSAKGIDHVNNRSADAVRGFVKEFMRPQEAAMGARGGVELVDELAFARDEPALAPDIPPTVTRYTDITCPRQVWAETPRFAVTVRLTLAPVAESDATGEMALRTDLPVTVTIDAPGFDVLEARTLDLEVPADRDSARITFMLRPKQVGAGVVILEFRQAGNLAGVVTVPVLISDQPVEAIADQISGCPLSFDENAPVPDRTLMIGYAWEAGRFQLTFRLMERATGQETLFPPRPLTASIEAYVTDLYAQLTHHANQAAGHLDVAQQAEAERLIRQIGRKLWQDLLPQDLRRTYLDNWQTWQDSSLLIVSDEPHVPWELIWPLAVGWDGPDEPWCLTLRLSRWLRQQTNGDCVPGPTTRLRWQRFGAIVPNDTRLPFAQAERAILRQVMARNGMQDHSPAHFVLADVLDLFGTGEVDWVHAATHGTFRGGNPGHQSTLTLAEQETFCPDDLLDGPILGHLAANRPGIVFNTCDSGRQGWGLTGAGGWASQLVGSGAGIFLAAQWSVTDRQAVKFAERFYLNLEAGQPVAQAVRSARQAARRDGDPTWLAYSLYAHPGAVVSRA